ISKTTSGLGNWGALSFTSRTSTSTRWSCRGFSMTSWRCSEHVGLCPHSASRSSLLSRSSTPAARSTWKCRCPPSLTRRRLRAAKLRTSTPRSLARSPTEEPGSRSSGTE
ncbi:hypothetical protein N325_06905, partial [Colius striatus]